MAADPPTLIISNSAVAYPESGKFGVDTTSSVVVCYQTVCYCHTAIVKAPSCHPISIVVYDLAANHHWKTKIAEKDPLSIVAADLAVDNLSGSVTTADSRSAVSGSIVIDNAVSDGGAGTFYRGPVGIPIAADSSAVTEFPSITITGSVSIDDCKSIYHGVPALTTVKIETAMRVSR
jgi:hypothetical protein